MINPSGRAAGQPIWVSDDDPVEVAAPGVGKKPVQLGPLGSCSGDAVIDIEASDDP